MPPAPWNIVGLIISITLVLTILLGVLVLIFKLGYRPLHKPMPTTLPKIPEHSMLTSSAPSERAISHAIESNEPPKETVQHANQIPNQTRS